MTAIQNIGLFTLGNKKGTIAFVIFIIVVAIDYVYSNIFIGIETIIELTTPTLLIFETLIAIILNIISFYACVKIYSIKNSYNSRVCNLELFYYCDILFRMIKFKIK